jgi:hypothetical protein
MATSFVYNATYTNCAYIYRATGGGVTFSANLAGAVFDYFTDTAVTNDAIYFSPSFSTFSLSNLKINVGTALAGAGVTGVWEYGSRAPIGGSVGWRPLHTLTDPSVGFTVTGANTIVFPVQAGMYATTVNAITGRCWIRYRITGGTVSEGGANQTITPQTSNGQLYISGGSDLDYATFTAVYNWAIINAPEIGATSVGNVFNFPNMVINIQSRLKTTNEIIFLGNGGDLAHNFTYLESGIKVGTDGWSTPSQYFFCQQVSGSRLVFSAQSKVYGGTWGGFTAYIDGQQWPTGGYLGLGDGEFIGVSIDTLSSGYFGNSIVANKCSTLGQIISTSFPTTYPSNHRISTAGAYIWGLYYVGGTITGLSYVLPTSAIFNFNQSGGESYTINMNDCSPSLPLQTGSVKVVARTQGTLNQNVAKVFYYDTSAGTFTDYTTQASNATADDVPLSGDVGDIYYFQNPLSYMQAPLNFTITNQSNDYVYAWEYYNGSWVAMNKTWDLTENFTKSGVVWNAHNNLASITINSVTGSWIRLRIVNKGTATPVCTTIKNNNHSGVGDWRIYEQLSTTFKCVDSTGTPIANVALTLTDNLGNVTNVTTNALGETTKTYFKVSTVKFDPVNATTTDYNVTKTDHNPYTITATLSPYNTVSFKMSLTNPNAYQVIPMSSGTNSDVVIAKEVGNTYVQIA